MKKKIIFVLAALSMAACEKECGPAPTADNVLSILPEIAQVATKTSYTGSTAAWANSDVVGLYCAQSYPAAANLAYTYASSGPSWTSASAIYWKDGTTVHQFYAYAPWASGTPAVTAVPLPALTPQTGAITPAQDFLLSNNQGTTGVSRTGNVPLPLTFTHVFSLIELDIKIDASIAVGTTLTSFTLASGTSGDKIYTGNGNSTIDLTSGNITYATGGSATLNTLTATSGIVLNTAAKPVYMLVLPGSFGTMSLSLVINEGSANITIPTVNLGVNSFVKATKYAFQVTVSRTAITISTPIITDWTAGTGGSVTAGL